MLRKHQQLSSQARYQPKGVSQTQASLPCSKLTRSSEVRSLRITSEFSFGAFSYWEIGQINSSKSLGFLSLNCDILLVSIEMGGTYFLFLCLIILVFRQFLTISKASYFFIQKYIIEFICNKNLSKNSLNSESSIKNSNQGPSNEQKLNFSSKYKHEGLKDNFGKSFRNFRFYQKLRLKLTAALIASHIQLYFNFRDTKVCHNCTSLITSIRTSTKTYLRKSLHQIMYLAVYCYPLAPMLFIGNLIESIKTLQNLQRLRELREAQQSYWDWDSKYLSFLFFCLNYNIQNTKSEIKVCDKCVQGQLSFIQTTDSDTSVLFPNFNLVRFRCDLNSQDIKRSIFNYYMKSFQALSRFDETKLEDLIPEECRVFFLPKQTTGSKMLALCKYLRKISRQKWKHRCYNIFVFVSQKVCFPLNQSSLCFFTPYT